MQKDSVVLMGLGKNQAVEVIQGGHCLGLTTAARGAPVWSLALDVEGGRVASRRGYVPCCAGENPLPTQTFLLYGCTEPAVRSPGTPQAAVLGGSKREEKLREKNLSKSGGLSQ